MLPGLNYDKNDLRFILLGKVFKFIENGKLMDEYNRCGIHNRSLFLICLKIFFMHAFFSYPISGVVDELNRQSSLRNFAGISEVPSENQVYEYFSRYGPKTYCEIANAILRKLYRPRKTRKDIYITDATPVKCDINTIKKYITPEHLKKIKIKMGLLNY